MSSLRLGTSLVLLLHLGSFLSCSGSGCPDDPEDDLCGGEEDVNKEVNTASSLSTTGLAFAVAISMQRGGAQHFAWIPLVLPLASMLPAATAAKKCKDLKAFYKTQDCCSNPDQSLTKMFDADTCPYNFAKPACEDAEPQAPRDLSTGATGQKIPKAAVLTPWQANSLPLTNVHFHLGAEHKSDYFNDGADSIAYDGANHDRRLAAGSEVRPGWMCPKTDLTESNLESYEFKYCKGQMKVGNSYEVHYVHSSAGYTDAERQADKQIDGMDDGLGGAANGRGMLNPMVAVQGQVYQIVNNANLPTDTDILHGWSVENHTEARMYMGSTTGGSHNNKVCSPYAITWHVDLTCHRVSPEAFDNLCKQKEELYKLENDLWPHHSRVLVDTKYVVKSNYVYDLPPLSEAPHSIE